MSNHYLIFYLLLLPFFLNGQQLEHQIQSVHEELRTLKQQEAVLYRRLEDLKLSKIQRDLRQVGLPTDDYIMHQAMALSYSEPHEQARWVAHIILPDIIEGQISRTNDFRVDPMVATGTAVEEDYFLKFQQADNTTGYDGFGYDRGHLAPSADFRWSETALSESYYYSNMSPQVADFNRGAWADLESTIRGYLFQHPETQLYVVTGGILRDGLPVIERSVNSVSIPEYFFKVVMDLNARRGIGFILPNNRIDYPLESYAVSIDEVEARTGLDFFNLLPVDVQAGIESRFDKSQWVPEVSAGDVDPLYPPDLPRGHFNSVQAKQYMGSGEEIIVCGTVVSTRYSRSGNLWLNLDKKYPNHIFSVYIRKEDLVNFPFEGDQYWLNEEVCFRGQVQNMNGVPTIRIEKEEQASLYKD
ncbi:MAG: DNA/RNA non-specific endonuclease [Saprospiraceae bacterium]|nr:DNA/RNA non-specific endonuclease [Lewinella sp.]